MNCKLFIYTLLGFLCYLETCFGLGINCQGSSECKRVSNLNSVKADVCSKPPGNIYRSGDHIGTYCPPGVGGTAAFIQFVPDGTTITAAKACELLGYLQDHGCKGCGSVPLGK